MHGPSAGQLEKRKKRGYACWKEDIIMPTARPMQLPIAIEGKNIPAGTRLPKVTAVRIVFEAAVTSRRKITKA
jgi:hypothetical protein